MPCIYKLYNRSLDIITTSPVSGGVLINQSTLYRNVIKWNHNVQKLLVDILIRLVKQIFFSLKQTHIPIMWKMYDPDKPLSIPTRYRGSKHRLALSGLIKTQLKISQITPNEVDIEGIGERMKSLNHTRYQRMPPLL